MTSADFRIVVEKHKDRVYTYAVWMLGDREEARDVTQETLMRLWKHHDQVQCEKARAWLLWTAYRLCIDGLRRRATQRAATAQMLRMAPVMADDESDRSLRRSELQATLVEALSNLSARDRAIVLLRDMDDLSYEEIAAALELPIGTLKAALHRARERLRDALTQVGVTP